jgi:hypothetical protein
MLDDANRAGTTMIKLLGVSAATFLALATTFASGARACDEDCAYEAHEAAYERAYERESMREEAAEEGYYSSEGRRSSRSSRRREQAAQKQKASSESRIAEPKPDPEPRTQSRTPRTKLATENSSISGGSSASQTAEDDTYNQPVKAVGCKKYIASAGVTLSVPCE